MPPAPNTSKRCAGGTASSVRIVASLVSRFASRPALVCWHAATVDVRQDLFLSTDTSSANMPSLGGNSRPSKSQPGQDNWEEPVNSVDVVFPLITIFMSSRYTLQLRAGDLPLL